MKFTKRAETNVWLDAATDYYIRRTADRYYVYDNLRYIGSRDNFDEAQELARKDAKK